MSLLPQGGTLPHVALLVCLLTAAVGVAGCRERSPAPADEPPPSASDSTLRITFAGTPGTRLAASDVRAEGDIPVTIRLVSSNGGTLKVHDVDAERVGSRAARFPRLDATREAPASALVVSSHGHDDELDPGDRRFTYGATVRLDGRSESDAPRSADNGNNILQKGLFLDRAQYKLQVDHGLASCRVEGTAGALVVKAQVTIRPGVWYRLACARSKDSLTIAVDEFTAEGVESVDHQVARGVTGRVDTSEGSTYLSIGAKVGADGAIPASSTDQLNGLVGGVFVNMLGHE